MNMKWVLFCVLLLFLVSCSSQEIYLCKDGSIGGGQGITSSKVVYYCPDGQQTVDPSTCSFEKPISITQKVAEKNAMSYVNGYVQSTGGRATLVNAYISEGEWYAQVVIAPRDESAYETLIKVDGKQGTASCENNCPYVSLGPEIA